MHVKNMDVKGHISLGSQASLHEHHLPCPDRPRPLCILPLDGSHNLRSLPKTWFPDVHSSPPTPLLPQPEYVILLLESGSFHNVEDMGMGTLKPTPPLLGMVTGASIKDLVIQSSTTNKDTAPIWTSEISLYLLSSSN